MIRGHVCDFDFSADVVVFNYNDFKFFDDSRLIDIFVSASSSDLRGAHSLLLFCSYIWFYAVLYLHQNPFSLLSIVFLLIPLCRYDDLVCLCFVI